MLWKACSLQVDVNSITYALNTLLENGSTPATDSVCKKQDCREEEKLEEVTENQKERIEEKERQHNKQVQNEELQHRTQQEETRLDNQQQQETGGHQQPQQNPNWTKMKR